MKNKIQLVNEIYRKFIGCFKIYENYLAGDLMINAKHLKPWAEQFVCLMCANVHPHMNYISLSSFHRLAVYLKFWCENAFISLTLLDPVSWWVYDTTFGVQITLWEQEYDIFVLWNWPKTSSYQLPYQRHSSSADCARKLVKGSNESVSHLVYAQKRFFWLGVADFLWVMS